MRVAGSAELDSDEMSEVEVARQVAFFLRKATDTQVKMMPEGVEQYVLRHQHDVAREERWRTSLSKDLSALKLQVKAMQQRADEQRASHTELLDAVRALTNEETAAPHPRPHPRPPPSP